MARNSLGKAGLALPAHQALAVLGANIQTARKRRGWTLEEMAGSMLVTRKTLSRLETGDPAVGLSVLAAALHLLGMEEDLQSIAAPAHDVAGIFSEKQRLPQRVRKKLVSNNELDF
jgi:transcriptional regulator with XRE-family HTH domain